MAPTSPTSATGAATVRRTGDTPRTYPSMAGVDDVTTGKRGPAGYLMTQSAQYGLSHSQSQYSRSPEYLLPAASHCA